VRVVEDRSSGHRELVTASVAVELIAFYDLRNLVGLAARAFNFIWPAQRLKISAAAIFAAKLLNQTAKIYGVRHV
jgi:hypothetical protein